MRSFFNTTQKCRCHLSFPIKTTVSCGTTTRLPSLATRATSPDKFVRSSMPKAKRRINSHLLHRIGYSQNLYRKGRVGHRLRKPRNHQRLTRSSVHLHHEQWKGDFEPKESGLYHFKLYYAGYTKCISTMNWWFLKDGERPGILTPTSLPKHLNKTKIFASSGMETRRRRFLHRTQSP